MKGIAHVIGISKKMEDTDAIAYLEYHRHMQTIKLQRLRKELSATEGAIETLEEEIKRRKDKEKANRE
ncbi:MAG: hypothetical protein DRN95_05505 [Candidatus Hydrothermarchaeota archaeon]|nr:MAG: hypothetical protein DRN95_05505 [Candidatus Hydrothermarchaeota archaeon]